MENKLLEIKPDLSKKSVKVYVNTINKIIKDLKGSDDLKFLEDDKNIIKYLNGLNVSYLTVRNYYNTIIVFLQALNYPDELIKKYQDNRDKLNEDYIKQQKTGDKTEKQSKNWATLEEINKVVDDLDNDIKKTNSGFNNKKYINKVQLLFILKFYLLIPLRNDLGNNTKIIKLKDYNKLSKEDKDSTNYYVYSPQKSFLSLSQYKTFKKYGLKIIDISKEIKKYFSKWYSVNPNPEYLLVNLSTNEPMTPHKLTILLTNFFKKTLNKNIASTMLRHIVCSEKFSKMKKDSEKLANMMCHSTATQQMIYVKN